jgi:uncharacterized protein YcfL
MKKLVLVIMALLLLSACRNETQNQIRRSLQDFTSDKMYITLYSLDGTAVFEGIVDGKVTRSSETLSNTSDRGSGAYIYWFDEQGRYLQTDLPYLVSSFQRSAVSQ